MQTITNIWELEKNKVVHVKVKREIKTGTENTRLLRGRALLVQRLRSLFATF